MADTAPTPLLLQKNEKVNTAKMEFFVAHIFCPLKIRRVQFLSMSGLSELFIRRIFIFRGFKFRRTGEN